MSRNLKCLEVALSWTNSHQTWRCIIRIATTLSMKIKTQCHDSVTLLLWHSTVAHCVRPLASNLCKIQQYSSNGTVAYIPKDWLNWSVQWDEHTIAQSFYFTRTTWRHTDNLAAWRWTRQKITVNDLIIGDFKFICTCFKWTTSFTCGEYAWALIQPRCTSNVTTS